MKHKLSAIEARIIGVLLEKEVTTPDAYPMTLNAMTNACNQKSSRDPVMSLSESEVQSALDCLKEKHLVMPLTGQRALKYKHRFCNTEFSDFQISKQETAIFCLLLLRGPQTAGELRTRSQRLADFKDVAEVEEKLAHMSQQEWVVRLPREPGRREARYGHLLGEQLPQAAEPAVLSESVRSSEPQSGFTQSNLQSELSELREVVTLLQAEVESLSERLSALEK